jgi:hypothetical protein
MHATKARLMTKTSDVTLQPKRYVFQCVGCDLLFCAWRSDQLTCSPACRVRWHRLSRARKDFVLKGWGQWSGLFGGTLSMQRQLRAALVLVDAGLLSDDAYRSVSIAAESGRGDIELLEVVRAFDRARNGREGGA